MTLATVAFLVYVGMAFREWLAEEGYLPVEDKKAEVDSHG